MCRKLCPVDLVWLHSMAWLPSMVSPTHLSINFEQRNLPICRNLALLEAAGARLVRFSPMEQGLPPGIAGLYLGGGYPERHARQLAANRGLKAAMAAFARAGGVVYAECGGLMYLSQSLQPLDNLPAAMGKAWTLVLLTIRSALRAFSETLASLCSSSSVQCNQHQPLLQKTLTLCLSQ